MNAAEIIYVTCDKNTSVSVMLDFGFYQEDLVQAEVDHIHSICSGKAYEALYCV